METFEPKILLGFLHGLWGIKGWLKVFSYTQPKRNIGTYPQWWIGGNETSAQPRRLENFAERGKNGLAVKLEGIDDRDSAAKLLREKIWIPTEYLAPLSDDEYYWHQLIGQNVVNLEGQPLGMVSGLIETGAHDVLVVNGNRERLIPYVSGRIVKCVDLQAHTITVDWDSDY